MFLARTSRDRSHIKLETLSCSSSCTWCALETEFEVIAPVSVSLTRIAPARFVLELLTPRAEREVGVGGVVLVPLRDQLLEVVGAQIPHLCRSVRL